MPNKEPIRCFEGTAKPHERFWSFRDATEETEAELELYGYISEYSWFEDDITPAMFKKDLEKHGNGNPIIVRINSYGGDVIAASLMRTMLMEYPGKVTVQIDGIAASAATVVALGGDLVRIQDTAYFMIHDPLVTFFYASLNIEDLNQLVTQLSAIKAGIVNAYEGKTGLSRDKLSKLMSAETWMDANEAKAKGFVDEVITGSEKKAALPQNAAIINALRNYINVPAELLKQEPDIETKQAVERLRAEAKLLI
ncbi:MAG: head maturation protease, ClpP-related [Anaerolineaceae bacterium]